jgi:hypothetical protein
MTPGMLDAIENLERMIQRGRACKGFLAAIEWSREGEGANW